MEEIFGDRILEYKDEIIRHVCELVRIKSVQGRPKPGSPFGEGVGMALKYILDLGRDLGLEMKDIDGYAGQAGYGKGEKTAAVLVHLDVVPEGNGWTHDPYGGVIEDGKIYGRGSVDNKGPAIVALYSLKVLKDSGVAPKNRIIVIFGTNEESGMKDMDHYLAKEPLPDMGFSPDSAYPIFNREKGIMRIRIYEPDAQKGIYRSLKGGTAVNVVPDRCTAVIAKKDISDLKMTDIKKKIEGYEGCELVIRDDGDFTELTVKGKPAHASMPESGINAISYFLDVFDISGPGGEGSRLTEFLRDKVKLEYDGTSLGISCSDALSGKLTLNTGRIEIDEGNAYAKLDVRYPVTFSGDAIIDKIKEEAAGYGLLIETEEHQLPLYVKEDHPLIGILGRAYEKATGKKAELVSMGGGTYARTLKNNGVAFGSAEGANVHQAEEYALIDGLMRHARICTQAVFELACADI